MGDRCRPHDHELTVPPDPVRVQQLVAAERRDRVRVGGRDEERRVRIAKADRRILRGSQLDPRGGEVHVHPSRGVVLVRAQDHVVGDQQLGRAAPLNVDREPADRRIQRGRDTDDEREPVAGVDPARAVRAHLQRRREAQQLVAPIGPHEDPLAAGLQRVERMARDAEELVEGRVADGHLGGEDADHPGGDRERVVTREQVPAGAHDVPGRPLRDQLLRAQHHVLLVAVEEGQQLPVTPLHVAPVRTEPALELVGAEAPALEHDRRVEDAGRPRPGPRLDAGHEGGETREGLPCAERPTDVRRTRRGRVVGLERREEGDPPGRPHREQDASGLDRRERELVLVDAVRQGRAPEGDRHVRRLVVEPVQLEAVGQEAGRPVQAAVHDPGHGAVLGNVLPRAEQDLEISGPEDRVVEVLAGVGLAASDDVLVGQPEVLREDSVHAQPLAGAVGRLHRPEPGRRDRVEPERARVVEPIERPLPGGAIGIGPEPAGEGRPQQRDEGGAAAGSPPQVHVAEPALDRAAQHLVHKDVAVADREHGAVVQELDRDAGRVAQHRRDPWPGVGDGRRRHAGHGPSGAGTSSISDTAGIGSSSSRTR